MRWTWVLTGCMTLASCGGKAAADKPALAAKPAATPKFDAPDTAGPGDAAQEAAPDAKAPDAKADGGEQPEPDLGQRFIDPPWFRKTLFDDAVKTDFKRSQTDDQGLFSSQILFDLAAGTTSDDCAKHLEEKVGRAVPNLARDGTPERLTIRGNTERYTVTMVCGEVKGVMKAYVSYSWTS